MTESTSGHGSGEVDHDWCGADRFPQQAVVTFSRNSAETRPATVLDRVCPAASVDGARDRRHRLVAKCDVVRGWFLRAGRDERLKVAGACVAFAGSPDRLHI